MTDRVVYKYEILPMDGFGVTTVPVLGAGPVVRSIGSDPRNAARLVAWVEHDADPGEASVDFAVTPTGGPFDLSAADPPYVFVGTAVVSAWIVLHVYARPTP